MAPSPDPRAARYARQRILPGFGEAGQDRLSRAHAVVIGAGGLGSAVLPILAAAGVGTLTVIDDDLVDETNLHRQILHGAHDVGRPKVESALDTRAHPVARDEPSSHAASRSPRRRPRNCSRTPTS